MRKIYYFRVKPEFHHRMINVKAFSIFQILTYFNIPRGEYLKKVKINKFKIVGTKTLSSKIELDLTKGFKNKSGAKKDAVKKEILIEVPISHRIKIQKDCQYIKHRLIGDMDFYYCVNPDIIKKYKKFRDKDCVLIMKCCNDN